MIHFFEAIIKKRKLVIIIFICMAAICSVLMLGVGQNYDMSKYLPDKSDSKTGIDILKTEYSYNGSALLLLEQKSISEVLELKQTIESVDGIKKVVWLDDIADLKKPVELIDTEIRNNYFSDDNALLQIVFEEDDYAKSTHHAIDELKAIYGDGIALTGSAIDAYVNVSSISGNILTGILIAFAIVLFILIITTNSLIEVALFIISIGIAILLNLGTNVVLGEISYMTFASAAILQLAISMDYSIFLLHRFEYERQTEGDPEKAMARAVCGSFSSIISSGMTTIVGFIALIFMSYTMGADMGFVLAKGIIFSMICVFILLPALSVGWVKGIDKTKHKRFLPSMKKVQHLLGGKVKYVIIGLLAIISIVCFMAQNNNTFLYSSSNVGDEKQTIINENIKSKFGLSNNFVVLVPKGNASSEYEMKNDLDALTYVKSVQGLYAFIDPSTPEEIVPENIKEEFLSQDYSRYIVEVDAEIESESALAAVTEVRQVVSKWYEKAYVTGASPVIYDIRNATSGDFLLVTILSILFVGIIILLTFRSVSIPLILLFVIESSIWINMSIPYFTGNSMIFIGYMVISAVQLGATIDYAILMTNYYLEGRKTLGKKEAAEFASEKAGPSILMSALVLASAGFVVAATFTQQAMSQLGTLIGRGAVLSGCLTIFVLPQVLILLDKLIFKTTMKNRFFRRRHSNEI
ncbi:MAG: efflux RND transporter permease subunit [Christensenellales bacterium]